MTDIYSLFPINKQASIVTSQSGCTSHNGLSVEQTRENLVSQWKMIQNKIADLPEKHPNRRKLGIQAREIQDKISSIRPKRKFDRGLNQYILDIVKSRVTKTQWHNLVDEAEKMLKKDIASIGQKPNK